MAPTIQVPAARINILENVLKKRTGANRVLKEREKQMLSGEDYQRMEVGLDNKPFLQPVDAEDTKAMIAAQVLKENGDFDRVLSVLDDERAKALRI
ncbi:hypothetical protein DL95DRAFT_471364 [Leptodontidium sp. 2 PMI_412]|nr:hypothetical protein DL95DRAFT_471364 [Leptodontidium sp. 2 PMI_412]